MNTKRKTKVNYRFMVLLTLVVGIIGIAFLSIPDFELLSFILTLAVLGGLIGGSSSYEEQERLLLRQSFQTAFEWLLLFVMIAYALIQLSQRFVFIEAVATFLNHHWPVFILSVMCISMGIAGMQKSRMESSN